METLPVPTPARLSAYERQALREIQLWKQPDTSLLGKAFGRVNQTLHSATDLVRNVPGVDWTIENVVSGLLRLTNEIVQDSVWHDAIYKEYQEAGHAVEGKDDIGRLDLEHVDQSLKGLDTKYRALATAEGAATGYAGASGIVPDVVALVALNLRAAGEYATYCGFDLQEPMERYYALQLLNAVSQPTDAAKQAALVPVIRVSHAVARQQTVQAVEQYAVGRAIRNVTRALGVRLTRAKLAQIVPVTGAVVGGSFNAYYTSKVCDAAFFLYRERFLVSKYGAQVLDGS